MTINYASMFDAEPIPMNLREKAKGWFVSQMTMLEKKHGSAWAENASWLAEYLNQELLERSLKVRV